MGRRVLFPVLLAVLSLSIMCGERSGQQDDTAAALEKSSSSSKETAAMVRFKTLTYIDKEGIGIEAFRMLIPSDWRFAGGIKWLPDNPGMPAAAGFRVWNPKGKEEFEVFPTQPFFWTDNQMTLSIFPVGSRYFGNEVRPVAGPIEALKQIVVPRFRHNASGLRIVHEEPLPDLTKAVGAERGSQPGLSASAEGARIRIEYNRGGTIMEEEIYTVVQSVSFPIQTMAGLVTNTNWYVDYVFSFKAEKGKLDTHSKTFQTIAYSFKVNPQWFNRYNQVVEYLVQGQIQRIHNVGQLSKIISQTSNEIREASMKSYYERQEVNDRIADNFSQYIRGVDKYYNPIEEKPVELPSGYENAWTNGLGEYILSESPSFNPNVGSNKNWRKMKRK
jgi:hypothetical protein